LLTSAEQHRLIKEWNDTAAAYPIDNCIHRLFEAQVERTPDAIALVHEDRSLTYKDLDRRANQLAQYLLRQGVGVESLVGICVERSIEMLVGVLGVLKAGGAATGVLAGAVSRSEPLATTDRSSAAGRAEF
jgi:non-ribosomal peptide synthetase component F